MINKRITYIREYDNVPVEGVLVERFKHTNDFYKETKDIVLIYYTDYVVHSTKPYFEDDDGDLVCESILITRPIFRYVDVANDRLKFMKMKNLYMRLITKSN